jgi:hypothetical protein
MSAVKIFAFLELEPRLNINCEFNRADKMNIFKRFHVVKELSPLHAIY